MKKIYLILFLMMMMGGASAQCFIYEGFDAGAMPPAGWTIEGLPAQWSVGNSNNAGGTMPEGKFTYTNGTTTTRLITPMMDLTGLTSVKLSFNHFYDWYSNPAPKVGVATRSHNGTWHSVYEVTPTGNVGPELKEITINNSDVGQTEFQFCFYLNGNMYNLDYWYVDNILFYNPLPVNASILSITTPKYISEPLAVTGEVMNVGVETVTSLEMAWQMDNGTVHTSNFTGLNLATEDVYNYSLTDLLSASIGNHDVKVWISKVNGNPDNDLTDDTLTRQIIKVCHTIPRMPMFEEFTSSTCAPCAQFNTGFVPWCTAHDSTISLLKYQMNWPGSGDPYYTEEGGVRRTFYGVNAVPDLYCNGGNVATDMTEVQQAFDAAQLQQGLLDAATTYTLNNKIITINSTVLPYANFNDALINIAVFEELTYNNVATNGETQFEHVMMKMVPDGAGTVTDLTDRTPFTINQTLDLTSTNIERWDDVSVVVFIQDQSTREIYQSKYAVQDGQFATEARLSNITINGFNLVGFNPDTFTYTVKLVTGSGMPEIVGTPIDPRETVILVPSEGIPGTATLDVFSQGLAEKNTYTINFDWAPLGGTDINQPAVNIYPNPTHGKIIVSGAKGADISIIDAKGQVMKSVTDFQGTTLDLSSYPKGVYLINVAIEGKTPVHKRVVVY